MCLELIKGKCLHCYFIPANFNIYLKNDFSLYFYFMHDLISFILDYIWFYIYRKNQFFYLEFVGFLFVFM